MKPLVIGYVPPPGKCNSEAFLKNMQMFKTEHELLLFSEYDYGCTTRIGNPENLIRKGANPEKFLISNALFFTACTIALKNKATHILYVESDSRVRGDYWDKMVFDEFFAHQKPLIAGGSMVGYNVSNAGSLGLKSWYNFVKRSKAQHTPLPCYGWKSAGDGSGSCLFPNGSLGIYSLEWLGKLFELDKPIHLAFEKTAWDQRIGLKAWELFGTSVYDLFVHLNSIFSGYGNVMSTQEERQEWLMKGKAKAVHQIKDDWIPKP